MVNWTEQQLAEYLARNPNTADTRTPPFKLPANQAGAFALGRLPLGTMNKTEAAYASYLEILKHAGEVLWWKFEGVKLRLAYNTFYTPDFAVLMADGLFHCHEVKGFWRDDALVKIKVAASIYPFRFIAVKKVKEGWQREEFS